MMAEGGEGPSIYSDSDSEGSERQQDVRSEILHLIRTDGFRKIGEYMQLIGPDNFQIKVWTNLACQEILTR